MTSLQGVALVTGGGAGLGRACALTLGKRGASVALLKDKAKLTAILTYHVVAGKVMAADVVKLKSAKTVQGSSVMIDTKMGVKDDGANVVKTDIVCTATASSI